MIKYYDYPERSDRNGIFDISDDNYFLKSDLFTYLCSYDEAQIADKQNVFLGSYVLITYKRYAVIEAGEVYYKNENFSDGHLPEGRYKNNGFVIICDKPKDYYIHSWQKYFASYEVRDDSSYNQALNVRIFKTAEEAVKHAIKLSEKHGGRYLVACWFDDFDRH